MAYYCRKCHRWHKSGKIAQAHKIFSAKPPRGSFRPKTTKKTYKKRTKTKKTRRTRSKPKKIKKIAPNLIVTHKKKKKKGKPKAKVFKLRKPSIGLSKRRRGQLRMKNTDVHERRMVKRIRSQTGMTHIQVMNLVNLGSKSDYIDIETEITSASGFSSDRTEIYEFAKKRILKKLDQQGKVMMDSKYNDPEYYDNLYEDWLEREKRRKKKKKNMMDLI